MIIGVSGFGCSGSSAVIDYLKGFEKITVYDYSEFQLLHQADGINDLKYHLTKNKERITVNVAINRFLRLNKFGSFARAMHRKLGKNYDKWYNEYVKELVKVSWKGESSAHDPTDISNKPQRKFFCRVYGVIEKLIRNIFPSFHIAPYRTKFFSIMNEKTFDEITKRHLRKLFELLGIMKTDIVVVDMLFSATNPTKGMEFFDEVKNINVTRDPRDVYVAGRRRPDFSRFMPNVDVGNFIEYYKGLNEVVCDDERNYNLQYEDLIYRYEDTCSKIRSFIGINGLPENEFVFFDPTISVKYTHRTNLYDQYSEDVGIISNYLERYIYNFENAVEPIADEQLMNRHSAKKNIYKGYILKR